MSLRVFYLCHPVGGDVPANVSRAKLWIRWLHGAIPDGVVIAPWILDLEVLPLRDDVPAERERGLERCGAVARRCTGVLLAGGRISTGMQREASEAYFAGVRIYDLTDLGTEPPELLSSPVPLLFGRDWFPKGSP